MNRNDASLLHAARTPDAWSGRELTEDERFDRLLCAMYLRNGGRDYNRDPAGTVARMEAERRRVREAAK